MEGQQINPGAPITMTTILDIVKKLKASIPVEWDRFTQSEEGYYVVYGWIARSDGERDFLLISMFNPDSAENVFFATSSAKYSEQIAQILFGSSDDHCPCRKIEELMPVTA